MSTVKKVSRVYPMRDEIYQQVLVALNTSGNANLALMKIYDVIRLDKGGDCSRRYISKTLQFYLEDIAQDATTFGYMTACEIIYNHANSYYTKHR